MSASGHKRPFGNPPAYFRLSTGSGHYPRRSGGSRWANSGSGSAPMIASTMMTVCELSAVPMGVNGLCDVLDRSAPRPSAICAQQQLRSLPRLA